MLAKMGKFVMISDDYHSLRSLLAVKITLYQLLSSKISQLIGKSNYPSLISINLAT